MTTSKHKSGQTSAARLQWICRMGMLCALALVFGYLESMLPLQLGIPGVKLGLANLVTMVTIYTLDIRSAWIVMLCRVLLSSMLFGNLSMLLYSLTGAIGSLLIMMLCLRINGLSKTGVCIAGGVTHNLGQLAVARLVTASRAVYAYFPVLCVAGAIAGLLIGVLASLILQRRKGG